MSLDPESIKVFEGIHASKEFTVENAHKAFAGLKRRTYPEEVEAAEKVEKLETPASPSSGSKD